MDFSIWSILLILTKFWLYASGLTAIGGAMFWLIFGHKAELKTESLIKIAGSLTIMSSIGFLLVQTGYIMEDGIAGMFDVEMLQIFLDEKIGTSLYMRLTGSVLLLLIVALSERFRWLMILPIVMLAGSFSLVGHASGDDFIYTAILLTLHLLAVSFWVGALLPLYWAAERDFGVEMLEKFGQIAAFIVPTLIVVGILFAVKIVGSFAVLFNSAYGMTLLAKVAIVGLLLGLATLNKVLFVPQIAADKPLAVVKFKRVVIIEALAFGVIFMATAIFTTNMALPE